MRLSAQATQANPTKTRRTEQAFRLRMIDHCRSFDARRCLRVLESTALEHPQVERHLTILRALVLVETRERPPWRRLLEWVLRATGRSVTCGPLQIRDGPFRLKDAYLETAMKLSSTAWLSTWSDAALLWYGSRRRQPGCALSYDTALKIADRVIRQERRTLRVQPPTAAR